MKKFIFKKMMYSSLILIMVTFLTGGCTYCQDNRNKPMDHQQQVTPITPDQATTIKKILSGFNPSKLTAAEAKAIHEKFRQAGIHAGPESRDAIKAAGFDPELLRTLDPPPAANEKDRQGPPSPEERMKSIEATVIKPLSLTASQNEVVVKAFKDFLAEMESMKKKQLNQREPLEKSKVEPIEKKRDARIKQVLSADQYKKYEELEKASRPHREGQPQPGQK